MLNIGPKTMNIRQSYLDQLPLGIARELAETFAQTAAERDKQGVIPKLSVT